MEKEDFILELENLFIIFLLESFTIIEYEFSKEYKKLHKKYIKNNWIFFHSSSESSILEGRVKYFGVFVGELRSVVAGVRGVNNFVGEFSGDLNIDCLGNAEGTTKVDDGGGDCVESDVAIGDLNIDILGFLGAFSWSEIGGGIIGAVNFLDGPANEWIIKLSFWNSVRLLYH